MRIIDLILKKYIFLAIIFLLIGCEKKEYYDIDFIVKNNCEEQIKVDYTIRVCSSIDNECSPQDFSDIILQSQSIELYVRDNMSEDANIEDVFYKLEIFKGTEKSNKEFWNTDKLIETKFEDRYEFVLTVDSSFFQ